MSQSRRRVLSEILPSENHTPPKRRRSLGFSMVKIATSPKPMNHHGSFIPLMSANSRGLSQRLSFEAEMQPDRESAGQIHDDSHFRSSRGPNSGDSRRNSDRAGPEGQKSSETGPESIKGAKIGPESIKSPEIRSERQKSAENNPKTSSPAVPDKYRRLLSINNNLNLKTRILSKGPPVAVHDNESAYTAELVRENQALDAELARAEAAQAQAEQECGQFRQLYKALRAEARELENGVRQSEGRFELLSSQITCRVEHEELLLHQALQKLRSDRDAFLRESRLEVEAEIKANLDVDDSEVVSARRQRLEQLDAVQAELRAFEADMARQVAAERRASEAELAELSAAPEPAALVQKRAQLALLSEQAAEKSAGLDSLQASLAAVERETAQLQIRLQQAQELGQKLDADELASRARLSSASRRLDASRAHQQSVESRLSHTRACFDAENSRYQRYLSNRRALEFSIMAYTQKYDVLVVPEESGAAAAGPDAAAAIGLGTTRQFAKSVVVGSQKPLSVGEKDLSAEWHLLFRERAQLSAQPLFVRFFGRAADPRVFFDALGPAQVQSLAWKNHQWVDLLQDDVSEKKDGLSEKKDGLSEKKDGLGEDLGGFCQVPVACAEDLERLLENADPTPSLQIYSVPEEPTLYVATFPAAHLANNPGPAAAALDALRAVLPDCTVMNVCDTRHLENESLRTVYTLCDGFSTCS